MFDTLLTATALVHYKNSESGGIAILQKWIKSILNLSLTSVDVCMMLEITYGGFIYTHSFQPCKCCTFGNYLVICFNGQVEEFVLSKST